MSKLAQDSKSHEHSPRFSLLQTASRHENKYHTPEPWVAANNPLSRTVSVPKKKIAGNGPKKDTNPPPESRVAVRVFHQSEVQILSPRPNSYPGRPVCPQFILLYLSSNDYFAGILGVV